MTERRGDSDILVCVMVLLLFTFYSNSSCFSSAWRLSTCMFRSAPALFSCGRQDVKQFVKRSLLQKFCTNQKYYFQIFEMKKKKMNLIFGAEAFSNDLIPLKLNFEED